MRVIPRSLAGRLTLLLLLALLIAQGTAIFLFAGERISAVRHAHRENVVARAETVAHLLEDTPRALHGAIVAAASTEFVGFSLSKSPKVEEVGSGRRVGLIASDLVRALGVQPDRVRVAPLWRRYRRDDEWERREHVEDDDEDEHHDHFHGPRRWKRHWFTASIALQDGRWLNVSVGPPPGAPPWGWTFLLTFVLSALAVAAVAVWMARRISGPMRRLATAADQLGRGEDVEDLTEVGPLETRHTVRAFNQMRERLDRFVRDRTAMLAAISHDLRTPITSLRLQAEFVDDEDTREKIIASLDEMQRMTEETLAFIREDMTQEETRLVDVHALVDSVIGDLVDLGHDVSLEEHDQVLLACRSTALRRAIMNVMENAAVYGLRARARIEHSEESVRIVIEDEGPGIPETDLDRVFEPFVRLEASRNRETGGTGLGLAIARTIVRSHGGDVRMENRQEGGLRVIVTLPKVESP